MYFDLLFYSQIKLSTLELKLKEKSNKYLDKNDTVAIKKSVLL